MYFKMCWCVAVCHFKVCLQMNTHGVQIVFVNANYFNDILDKCGVVPILDLTCNFRNFTKVEFEMFNLVMALCICFPFDNDIV